MNLLFFASDYKIGLSQVLADQLIAINKNGRLSVFGVAGENEQEEGLSAKVSGKHIFLKRMAGLDHHAGFFRLVSSLSGIIKSEKIDVVHVQNNWQLMLVSFLKYRTLLPRKFKIVYTIHGFRNNKPVKSKFARLIIGSLLLLFADRIICMSDFVRRKFGLLSYKMEKIYLGIDDHFFQKKNTDISVNTLRLVYPAQFRAGKNQDLVIRAFSKYLHHSADRRALLFLPGSGELLEKSRDLALRLNIDDQVRFPGLVNKMKIRELYENCNIGLVSSNSETFGQSIVEPFVLGRCVITRRVGIATEIIKEGANGFFFDNETDLVNILLDLNNNKVKLLEINALNFSQRDIFSWDTISRQYEDFIFKNFG